MERSKTIDYLKGIAILGIIMVHFIQYIPTLNPILYKIGTLGQAGVQMFFLLSAFTLTASYMKNKPSIENFYRKRFSRIMPAYCLMIAAFFILSIITTSVLQMGDSFHTSQNLGDIIANIFLVHGLFPSAINSVVPGGWFIGTIILFYLSFPFIIKFVNYIYIQHRKIFYILPVAWVFFITIFEYGICYFYGHLEWIGNNTYGYFNFLTQSSCFLIGIILFFAMKDITGKRVSRKQFIFPFFLFLLISLILFFGNYSISFLLFPFFISCSFAFLYILLQKSNFQFPKWIVEYGIYSYSAYLIHTIFAWYVPALVMKFLPSTLNGNFIFFILIVPVYIAIYYGAHFFNRYIEEPLTKICKKYIFRLK